MKLSRENLHSYQHRAIAFIKSHPVAYLAIDCGMGKTISVLTALQEQLDAGEIKKVLILAPPRVVEHVWTTETKNWTHINLEVVPLVGTPKKRTALLRENHQAYAMSYDLMHWLVALYAKRTWDFDVIVADEASMLKGHNSRRVKSIRKIRKAVERFICLSGTPSANSLLGLWGQYICCDQGERLGTAYTRYRDRFWVDVSRMGWQWELRPGAEKHIHERIRDITVSMLAEDYLELPDLLSNDIRIYLPPNVRAIYEEIEKEFLITLEKGTDIMAPNSAVLSGKLRQISSGFLYDEEGETHDLHTAKLDALEEVIGESGGPVLVFYEFKADAARIKSRFKKAVDVKAKGVIEAWNRGEVPLLIGHFASMSHGLSLQHGGNVMVMYSIPWSNELYLQAIGRLHRQGQKSTTTVHHLVAADSIDEKVLRVLGEKELTQNALLHAMKAPQC
jgi:SNF2 family DNA or RNA helicase